MNRVCSSIGMILLAALLLASTVSPALAQRPGMQRVFDTPEDAVKALVAAAKANDEGALVEIFGTKHRELIGTVDKARDRETRTRFAGAAEEYQLLRKEDDGRIMLVVGAEAWPFPIPLVKGGSGWRFDTEAGAEELLNRRIGANELAAIHTLRAFVDAQRQYAAKPRQSGDVRQFAQRVRSTPGKRDGLYWDADPAKGEEPSPIGPLLPDAASRQPGAPYDGYYFKILTRQGLAAPAGRYSYVINGRMIAGFAMVAFPAEYGETGVKTFIVNHYGVVYEKDLGPRTVSIAKAMTEYNPDSTWSAVTE
jgi:Protein of unknown function (DUF2950)